MRLARVKKQKDCPQGQVYNFELEVVTLGLSPCGKPVTSCVVRHLTSGEAEKTRGDDLEDLVCRLWAGRSADEIINTAIVSDVCKFGGRGGSVSTRASGIMEKLVQRGWVIRTVKGPHNLRQWILTANGKTLVSGSPGQDAGTEVEE